MANINTRASVCSIMPEVTEGTPVKPAATTDYIPETADFSMNPNYDKAENEELKNSLGQGKSIVVGESPDASLSFYLKGSGTEGAAPQFADILEAAFGTETIDLDEETTAAGSTVSVVSLSANGSHHPRGSCLLIKDGTNGYSIRPVHSQSSEDLTLGFDLDNAPASGVSVGKAVTYSPANSGHQTLTMWDYLGNSGAIRMMTGARVTSLEMNFEATALAQASASFEGISFYFDPVEISSTNKYIDFDDGGGEENVSVPEKWYKDPHELADAIATAMDAATSDNITCVYSDTTGKFTIASDGVTLSLLWNTGTNTANGIHSTVGYSSAADDTGSTSYDSDSAIDLTSEYTPSFDSTDPVACKDMTVLLGDSDDNVCFDPSSVSVSLETPKVDELSLCAESGKSGSVVSSRAATITSTAFLPQYCADRFKRLRENTTTRFFLAGGVKSGGNWVAGKCFGIYGPTCVIDSIDIADNEGTAEISITMSTFVDEDGNGELYYSQV